ncbi:MAG: hypothetical protein OXI24_16770 [Candidatus Poribacteria bacterium]|nr:hypothetical protein [Candidatus Poribacteria bacterium]
MNEEKITTLDMFQLLREDIKSSEARLLTDTQKLSEDIKSSEARLLTDTQKQFSEVRSDIHALEDRLRKVEEAVAGKKAVTTFQKTLMDWLFRVAAAVGVGGAIKAFFS